MDIVTGNVGWIEVICGPMFSGKSEELIRRLRRAIIARKRVEVFKPAIDNRYSDEEIDATNPSPATARLLKLPHGLPLLRIRQVIYSTRARPTIYVLGFYRSDRHRVLIRRYR